MKANIFFLLAFLLSSCKQKQDYPAPIVIAENGQSNNYSSENLLITQLSEHTFRHESYLETKSFGKVACNGLIIMNDTKALVIDTPTNDEVSEELLNWIKRDGKTDVIGIVPTHFHVDCLGGLSAFHKQNTPSIASQRTIRLAQEQNIATPQQGFAEKKDIQVGDLTVQLAFLGEGHTSDNIVAYIPEDRVLFGGCLVKSLEAPKGNLTDANVPAWPATMAKVKASFPQASIIVPGHGEPGGQELLDYTQELFHYLGKTER